MSCEGNRQKFFQWASEKYDVDEARLEKIYQAAKARGAQDESEKIVHAHKTRILFGVMKSLGIKPPTHSPTGLPKADSCSGYAAVNDFLHKTAHALQANDVPFSKDEVCCLTDREGYYIESGYHKHTLRNRHGYTAKGYMEDGRHVWYGEEKGNVFRRFRFDASGNPQVNEAERERFLSSVRNGVYPDGYDAYGFDEEGYDELGMNHYGFLRGEEVDYRRAAQARIRIDIEREGYKKPKSYQVDIEGFDEDGFMPRYRDILEDKDRFGFNRKGFRKGRSWTGYDEDGLDAQGKPYPKKPWFDAWGYSRKTGLTEPDEQGRQFNLIGWQYDPKSGYCFNPEHPEQRIKHEGSWRYSRKHNKVILTRSYVPSEDELARRLQDPKIRMEEVTSLGSDLYRLGWLRTKYGGNHGAALLHHLPSARFLRSEMRAERNPDAAYMGVRLRCSKCGQFTGAKPHRCPAFDNKEIIEFSNGIVATWVPELPGMEGRDLFEDLKDAGYVRAPLPYEDFFVDEGVHAYFSSLASWIRKRDESVLVVLETPFRDDFDPEFEGGPVPGYSYETGVDKDGYDIRGINPITGKDKDGNDMKSLIAIAAADKTLQLAVGDRIHDPGTEVLVETYSRIATSMAGAPRRVILEEKGGPRDGMFSTDMKGTIHAERFPLGKDTFASHNLLAMKAGLYHELGHEEDTDVGVWARVLRIAKGEEEVEGLPKAQARMLADIYNIIEDGRMERLQARKRRGVAAVLAADSKINPRWDEVVGEEIPLTHQVMGMMLYRSLPFFRVRQEVFEKASPRARKLFEEIAPLVDRGTSGSAEDGLFAAVEVARILAQDEAFAREQQQGQGGQPENASGGGASGYFIIFSAMPNAPASEAEEVNGVPLPAPGQWGDASEADAPQGRRPAQEDEERTGKRRGKKLEELPEGKPRGKAADEDEAKKERKKAQPEQPGKSGKGAGNTRGLHIHELSPEPDEDFFFGVSENTDLTSVVSFTSQEILSSLAHRKNFGGDNKIVGKKLLGTLKDIDETLHIRLENGSEETIYTPKHKKRFRSTRVDKALLAPLDEQAQEMGKRFAQRLERLKASIRQRSRYRVEGRMDRRRFKRAVAGSRAVYQQTKDKDITSLAVGISVDMSTSMDDDILSGRLFGSVSTIAAAMDRLNADYIVSAFGSATVLLKTIGDKEYPLSERGKLSAMTLGGTRGAPSMALNTIGLSLSDAANKLQFVLSDGDFADTEQMIAEVKHAYKQGILPFGIYLGVATESVKSSFDTVYGKGNWVAIEHLEDFPKVAAGQIERIYRRLLATL